MKQRNDIIPDIHVDIDRLMQTLSVLGYVAGAEAWAHPEGRIAAFLGDFIDRGGTNRSVLTLVRAMHDQGHGIAIVGNHELNAQLYHRPGLNADGTDDGYMRAHSPKNTAQHQTFLDEFPVEQSDVAGVAGAEELRGGPVARHDPDGADGHRGALSQAEHVETGTGPQIYPYRVERQIP